MLKILVLWSMWVSIQVQFKKKKCVKPKYKYKILGPVYDKWKRKLEDIN